jgi:hypothetical protein
VATQNIILGHDMLCYILQSQTKSNKAERTVIKNIKLSRSAFFDEKSIPFHERFHRSS